MICVRLIFAIGFVTLLALSLPIAALSQAETSYRAAEFAEHQLRSFERVSNPLGFVELDKYEDAQLRILFDRALKGYFQVFQAREALWSNRSAFRIAALVEDFFEKQVLQQKSRYRSLNLPLPFFLERDLAKPIENTHLMAVGGEIRLLYSTLIESAEKLAIDNELLSELKAKHQRFNLKKFALFEKLKLPWTNQLTEGDFRPSNNGAVERDKDGFWKPVQAHAISFRLTQAVKKSIGTAQGSYALVTMAHLGLTPSTHTLQEAIVHSSIRSRLAGLVAAELSPRAELLNVLLSHWKIAYKNGKLGRELFDSLQHSLFGEPERTLLALRSLIKKDPTTIDAVLTSTVLPAAEKTWLMGSIPEPVLHPMAFELIAENDPLTTTRALYWLTRSRSRKSQAELKKHLNDARPLVRLAAKRFLQIP